MPTEIKVPSVGESISEVEIGTWLKKEGEAVKEGETIVTLESDKATVELPAPGSGMLAQILKPAGKVAAVGEAIAILDSNGAVPAPAAPAPSAETASAPAPASDPSPTPAEALPKTETPAQVSVSAPVEEPKVMPAAQRVLAEAGVSPSEVPGTGPGGRVLKEDAQKAVEVRKLAPLPAPAAAPAKPAQAAAKTEVPSPAIADASERREERVRMSKLRRTVAARLVAAKQEAALLTTFNEADMSAIMTLRKEMQEAFTQRHGVKLGFMSFFVKAVIDGLRLVPQLNSEIRGEDIVYKNYFDIGVAIGGGKGLVVPVLRHAERMGFAQIEKAIAAFAVKAKDGKLLPQELEGGTFTISNGGVYGSLLSTPIVNPPQSGVLGMHTIQERPIALNGQVVIRPMMYLALTYDHRIVDGKEAVTFLKRVKEAIENPARILIEA